MTPDRPTIEALLDVARGLVVQYQFDGDVVLALLSRVAGHGLDTQTVGAVTHARLTIESGWKTSAEVATARFALARVVTLLEQHVRGRLRVVE